MNSNDRVRLGISSCLLGQPVRYDGQHKLDLWLRDRLGTFADYVPVCPEVESGFGTPREAMRLVGEPEAPRLYTVRTKQDVTETMQHWIRGRLRELGKERLDGYIFKSKSPSSGMERVKLYPSPEGGVPSKKGVGLFARAFMDRFPLLPVEDEGRLHDDALRENFIERVFVMHRWNVMTSTRIRLADFQAFHATHKLLMMAHAPQVYRDLGPLVAQATRTNLKKTMEQYIQTCMLGLKHHATPARHVNVLQHILGYFKKELSADEKKECAELMASYRDGLLPLIVPMTLINHYIRKFGNEYLVNQIYLHPHPAELSLRNHT
ncbi:MAG: DUF523 and DUF1722 domain-containing protein [Kiritimatiellae bacterium]|nr:DUF523 and DUF1722 domain-containing protein [Kiritimatiellia bacterium]